MTTSAATGCISLVTEVPGPKSQAIVERRVAATSKGAAYLTELSVASAQGAIVTDVDGNQLLDFAGGIGVLAAGHCPPTVVEAIKAQADKLIHMCAIVGSYEPFVELAETLNAITPGDFEKKSLLLSTGAEAVEAAVKIARAATGRQAVLVFEGAYHGRSNLTMGMTSKYALFKKGFGPFAPEIYRVPFPNVYRRPPGMEPEAFVGWSIDKLHESLVSQIDADSLAAIVIEPVQGEGGFVPAPAPFLQAIRSICDAHGVVMVADEIQSGFGRTGKLFAIEHSDVVPDLITMAKSLASGMPLAAVTGRAELVDAPHPGGMGGTYSGNPLACVAGLESIAIINTPQFLDRATAIGERMRSALLELQVRYPDRIGDVRGVGPMLAIELVADSTSATPDPDATLAITKAALQHGLIIIRAGLFSNCVRFLPPLTVSDAQVDEAMAVLSIAVDEVLGVSK
ncbi:MAG: 4-aminobutyrate--2-oxoglutarate transaminase [Acidimicrobiales bacterium]